MKRLVIALTLTTVAFGLLAGEANAGNGPFQKWLARSKAMPKTTLKASGGLFQGLPYTRYQSVEDAYPRYIGAFHSRYFNDLGVAPGDVGIRTNGIYMTPW